MEALKDNGFYLEIKLKDGNAKHVRTPSVDFTGAVYEYTYGDVIDAYTVKFNDMNELLDDIRSNGYAGIEDISNDDIASINFRHKDSDEKGCYSEVAYSNSLDVINYLYGSNDYRKVFEENFKRYVIGRVISKDKEYREFLCYNFTRIYSNALRCDPDKFALGEYEFNLGGEADIFYKYYNIRAHCLINHDKLNAVLELRRERKKGKPCDAEAAADLKEAIINARKDYPKRSAVEIQKKYLGDRFVPYPEKKYVEEDKFEDEEITLNSNDYVDDEPLFVEDGITVSNLSFGANIQDETEYTIDPDVYEDFLNNTPVFEDVKRRK